MKKGTNIKLLLKEFDNFAEKKRPIGQKEWSRLTRKHNNEDSSLPSKSQILNFVKRKNLSLRKETLEFIKMKPTRTISGVTPITIFTKPYMCSGECIFCPTSSKTPKSYLIEEPGIQRASALKYDPYKQVKMRIKTVEDIGHNAEKVELIISGGTWDDYEINYRIWYMLEVFRALNQIPSRPYSKPTNYVENIGELKDLHEKNTQAKHRNVGICIETRPDKIDEETVRMYRVFGVTKVQLGVQTLNEKVLEANTRGHSKAQTLKAIELLRLIGVNIHIHWMCNLYKSDPKTDYEDFREVFKSKRVKPDEIKIYPCSLVEGIKLHEKHKKGDYKPYDMDTLISLLTKCKSIVPKYCRINRLMRDIPSQLIIAGNKTTNLREKVQEHMREKNLQCKCIRCREVKDKEYNELSFKKITYETSISQEYFLEYITEGDKLAGFLRLSIYKNRNALLIQTPAMVRELHIYGVSLNLKSKSKYSKQHKGIGTKLLAKAEEIAKKENIKRIAVISAVGTRNYYKKRGYVIEKKYGYVLKNLD